MSTALQFMTTFRRCTIREVGRTSRFWWAIINADVDGTEEQQFLLMEASDNQRSSDLRAIQNPGVLLVNLERDPTVLWDHPRAETVTEEVLGIL